MPLPIWVILKQISEELKPVSDNPHFEAELLLANVLKTSRAELLSKIKENIEPPPELYQYIERRKKHEPIAYILGYTEFFGIKIQTRPPIFIPRPETELLVEESLNIIENSQNNKIKILELCTGTACISIAICINANKTINCTAIDLSENAIFLAKENANQNNAKIQLIVGDLFQPLSNIEKYDLIIANPPYISENDRDRLPPIIKNYEDSLALFSKDDGLDTIRKISQQARQYLIEGGWLLLEIGDNQKEQVEQIFEKNGYDNIEILPDLQNLPRVVKGRYLKS